MPDITMCKGHGCPWRNDCHRYRAVPSEYRQSYFAEPPFESDEFVRCQHFSHLCPDDQLVDVDKCPAARPDPSFKQDTPKQQAIAILQGIEGQLLNWRDGIKPSKESISTTFALVEKLRLLHETQLPDKWGER